MQNFVQICWFWWAKSWTLGQNRGQVFGQVSVELSATAQRWGTSGRDYKNWLSFRETFSTISLANPHRLKHGFASWTRLIALLLGTRSALPMCMTARRFNFAHCAFPLILCIAHTVPRNSISDQQSRQIAISFVFLLPNRNQRLLPGTASIRSSLPPHLRQCQRKSISKGKSSAWNMT
jgi:hypothetical protein